jgi:Ankyrin repeats (3 copies)
MITANFGQAKMVPSVDKKRTMERTSSKGPPLKRIRTILSSLPHRLQASDDENDTQTGETSPQEYLMEILKSKGSVITISSSLEVEGFFAAPTEEEISAYGHDVLTAVRTRDIKKLREYHRNGRPLKCSNKFGESLLHLACRRGFVDVVTFLIKEAGVTVRVIDDYGRTPLHDVCWTCEPNFELFELIMTACTDLLFMKDRRGHTPLEYARREHWGAYVKFLGERQDLFCRDYNVAIVG